MGRRDEMPRMDLKVRPLRLTLPETTMDTPSQNVCYLNLAAKQEMRKHFKLLLPSTYHSHDSVQNLTVKNASYWSLVTRRHTTLHRGARPSGHTLHAANLGSRCKCMAGLSSA